MRGIISLIALVACLGSFACRQGEGERCQVIEDCEDGLDCVGPVDNKTCESGGTSGIDAGFTPDAGSTPDASSVDAALPDATLPDATPSPDAA